MNKKNDYRYEYDTVPLMGLESKYISIPLSIITNKELDNRRVAAFSYLRIRCGIDDKILFNISDMVEWCGNKPNRKMDGINSKYLETINNFVNEGYLSYLKEPSKSKLMMCSFDMEYFNKKCENGFAILYLDEIEKIMRYNKKDNRNYVLNNTIILLVFAYLRHKIYRRPNRLSVEENYDNAIEKRKQVFPEAYNDHMANIAEDIGISSKTLSKVIDILECELGLIKTDRAYISTNENGRHKTPHMIFTNAYKREGKFALNVEEDYSRIESENKALLLKKLFKSYEINIEKRKVK